MANDQYFGRACKTCRRRGRGCDRRMPSCNTCETNGLKCEGYLLQWPGLASRGQLVGKSIPVTTKRRRTRRVQQSRISTPPLLIPQSPVLQSPQNPRNDNDQNDGQDNRFDDLLAPMQLPMEFSEDHTPSELLIWSNEAPFMDNSVDYLLTPQPNLDTASPQNHSQMLEASMDFRHALGPGLDDLRMPDELKFIMQYHICEVVPKLCVDNLSPQNPYRDYILPLATEVPSLLYACAALAACHYNVRLSTKQFEREFFRFKGKAMKRLQEDLYSPVRASHPGTLATILMLCLCDLCHGGISDFQSHFQGAKKLIELRHERTAGSFVEQYLAWLDVMAAASHSKPTVFSSQEISSLLVESGDQWSFDVIPCPSDQFEIICEIVALYKSQLDAENPSIETSNQVQDIKQRLLQKPVHCDRGQNWLHVTEAYRFAIILYLLRVFCCNIDEFELDWLVSSVLYHARATPPASGWSDQLLWPLFHAGLEVKDARRQEWIRERARCMQSSGGFGNVQSAIALLEDVWRGKRPSEYISLMQARGNGTVLFI